MPSAGADRRRFVFVSDVMNSSFLIRERARLRAPGWVQAGLRPSTIAETTKSSMPLPGAQVLISSRLSAFGVTRTSTKPASASQVSVSCIVAAPAMQPHSSAGSSFSLAGSGAWLTTSEIASRPPGFQRAKRLAEDLRLVRHEIDDAVREDHVRRVVGDRQMFELAQTKLDIAGLDLGRVLARLLQHLMRHVDADHPARLADLAGRKEAIEPGAAAEIDHRLAGLQCGNRLRVAAAEAEIGAFWHRGELGIRIAHLAGFAARIGGRAAAGRCRCAAARVCSPLRRSRRTARVPIPFVRAGP